MNRKDRERAQRISEYVDGLVVHQREEELGVVTRDDREFRELVDLARELSAVRFEEPPSFRADLHGRLPGMSHGDPARSGSPASSRGFAVKASDWLPNWMSHARVAMRAAATMAPLVAIVTAIVWHVGSTRTASAAEILSRADVALARLVHQGQILHRRWKVTERTVDPGGTQRVVRESTFNEWMDGSDYSRVAGRNESNHRVHLAYARVRDTDGEVRPLVYFASGFANERRGLLSIEPSRREFQEALVNFPPKTREKLQTYLDRGYIFEPISGERRFNRLALEAGDEPNDVLPRVVVSLREETLPAGTEVYAVRIIDPARVRFRWTAEGPPVARVEWRQTVRYIARDTYLSLKAEEETRDDAGRVVITTRELVDTQILERDGVTADPFALAVPEGTPTRRQSATEQLTAVAAALARIGELTR